MHRTSRPRHEKNPGAARRGSVNAEFRPEQSNFCTKPSAPSTRNTIPAENKSAAANKSSARRVRRRSKRRKFLGPARELHYYDGQIYLGVVKISSTGAVVAFMPGGNRIGSFASFEAACNALRGGAAQIEASAAC
jgi:hypothetical protein